jgi:hypothetical protein
MYHAMVIQPLAFLVIDRYTLAPAYLIGIASLAQRRERTWNLPAAAGCAAKNKVEMEEPPFWTAGLGWGGLRIW